MRKVKSKRLHFVYDIKCFVCLFVVVVLLTHVEILFHVETFVHPLKVLRVILFIY